MSGAQNLTRYIKRQIRRNYYLARLYHDYRFHRDESRSAGRQPVLVYQMGKVGSSSLCRSLAESAPQLAPYHIHVLTRKKIRDGERILRAAWDGSKAHGNHVWTSHHIARQIDRKGSHWKVVTFVRDPVGRNISSFFQILKLEHGIDVEEELKHLAPAELARRLEPVFFRDYADHDVPLTFFDKEMKAVFGIDVLSEPFPHDKGYHVYRNDKADVLLLKFERLADCAGQAVKEFLHVPDFRLLPRNVSEDKSYGAVLREFVAHTRIPADYLDRMYESRYARTFYTDSERAEFHRYWGSPSRSGLERPLMSASDPKSR